MEESWTHGLLPTVQHVAFPPSPRSSSIRALGIFAAGLLTCVWLVSSAMRQWDIDLAFSHVWWHAPHNWFGDRSAVCWFLYEFGPLPGVLLASGALVTLVVALFRRRLRRLALPALYIVMAFLLGPGLVVNGVLKHSWSRARPKELAEFGRKLPYELVFTHVEGSKGRSFPSGHASAAFFLCSLGFASAVWGTRLGMWTGLAVGVVWGALVAWSRIASGAHFLSDVLWSAALVNVVNFFALLPFIFSGRWQGARRRMESIAPEPGGPMKACS